MERFNSILRVENAITISLCFIVFAIAFQYFRRSGDLIPGPTRWPIVEHLPLMLWSAIFSKENSHELMTRLSRRYGNIFSLVLPGGNRMIVLSNFQMIKEALQKPQLSDKRPTMEKFLKVCGGTGILSASGKIWKQQRRFSMTVFRSFGVGKTSFDEFVEVEGKQLSDAVKELSDKPFNIHQLLMNATSNIICTIGFGKRFGYKEEEFRHLLSTLDERMKIAEELRVYARVPFYWYFRSSVVERLLDLMSSSIKYFNGIVSDHKKRFAETGGQCNDLTDMYIKAMAQEHEEGQTGSVANDDAKVALNEGDLANLIDNLFTAGTETSSNTLAWCFLHMIQDPDVQQQIRDEIHSVCGHDRMPRYSDRSNMPFTEAVILEVQRLHTLVPLGVPHYAGQETTLQGHTIPKGSIVIANLWAVHHDPDVWDDPDVFRPSRFIDQDGNITVKEEWMPFSIGRRVCLGEKLAKMEIFIFFTHLLARFTFTKPDYVSSVSFEGRAGVTFGPQPFEICAEPIAF